MLGLITAPFAPIFSPVVRANLLLVLAMPISATAAFVVLRKWRVWGPAAALGGLLYGFSPYMIGQSIAHLDLLFVPLPPFIALTIASVLQNRGSSGRLGVQLGLLVVAQYLISPEVLTSVAILTVAALVCIAIRDPANVRRMAHNAAGATGIALVVASALLVYPVWMSFFGPQHFTGPPSATTNPYHNDLLSSLVPTPEQRVSLGMRSLGNRLALRGGVEEADGYIGGPLLILTAILAWWSRRSPRMQLVVVLMLFAALLSLGPHLAIDGHLTDIPLPFLALDHLPVLDSMLPSRLSLAVDACLAAAIAFGLDDMRRAPEGAWIRRRRGGTVFATVTLAALVLTQIPVWPDTFADASAVALPAALTRAIPTGDPVAITYPYETVYSNEPMLWQAEDGFRFRLLGGYAFHPSPVGSESTYPDLMSPSGTRQFLANQGGVGIFGPETPVSPKLVATTRAVVSRYDIRLVIVDRSESGSTAVMELFNDALGRPLVSTGRFSMWADWHGRPSHEQFSPHISTRILSPKNNAHLSGTTLLNAKVKADYRIDKVAFILSDENRHSEVIADGVLTLFGWIAKWNTVSIANGTYSLQSIAYDEFGASGRSTNVTVTIDN